MTLTYEIKEEIVQIMEGYKNNPSNSNKFLHEMFALFENEEVFKEEGL